MNNIDKEHIYEVDLHGLNMNESKVVLDELFEYIRDDSSGYIRELCIVVGQGKGSAHGPVLPMYVGNYIREKGFLFTIENGVIKVDLKRLTV